MHTLLQRLQAALALQSTELARQLNPPATPEQIAAAEETMGGVRLPDPVCRAYLLHDGQNSDGPWLIEGCEWLSLERMVAEWQIWNELFETGEFSNIRSAGEGDGRIVRDDWWNPKWIPFTYDGSGNHYCIDLDPGELGQIGQIITMWHDSPERERVADDFQSFMAGVVARLEAGEVVWSAADETLVDKKDLG